MYDFMVNAQFSWLLSHCYKLVWEQRTHNDNDNIEHILKKVPFIWPQATKLIWIYISFIFSAKHIEIFFFLVFYRLPMNRYHFSEWANLAVSTCVNWSDCHFHWHHRNLIFNRNIFQLTQNIWKKAQKKKLPNSALVLMIQNDDRNVSRSLSQLQMLEHYLSYKKTSG